MPLPEALQAALAYLARREYSAAELRQRLQRKGCAAETIDLVLARCIEAGWQSDARYVAVYVRAQYARQVGPRRILAVLQPQVETHLIDAALAEYDWQAAAQHAYQKKFGDFPPASLVAKAKTYRFLQGRGFLPTQIQAVFRYEDEID